MDRCVGDIYFSFRTSTLIFHQFSQVVVISSIHIQTLMQLLLQLLHSSVTDHRKIKYSLVAVRVIISFVGYNSVQVLQNEIKMLFVACMHGRFSYYDLRRNSVKHSFFEKPNSAA